MIADGRCYPKSTATDVISQATKACGERGFTLLELLVVLIVAVLLIAVVPPLLSGLAASTELRGAAMRIAAALRFTRNAAVTRHREEALLVDLAQRRFQVSAEGRQLALPQDIGIGLHTAQSELLTGDLGSIRFFPDGSSTGGHIDLSSGRLGYRINVDWLTGRVTVQEQN